MRIALLTYSTKPRGGVVHTLALAEALAALGEDVTVWTLGRGGDTGFHRPVDPAVTLRVVPFPDRPDEGVGPRILRSIAVLRAAFDPADFDVVHAQDCITANAAGPCVRTVHHLDRFTTPELAACHERAIVEPYAHVCVSAAVAAELADGWGLSARVIPNGVAAERFSAAVGSASAGEWRAKLGRYVLSVGGIEPRKGSVELLEAFAGLGLPDVRLVVAGGETLFDYRDYRRAWEARAVELGVVPEVLGLVDDAELPGLVAGASAFAFPSTKEGFGLAAMEALAAEVPLVASDLPVLREVFAEVATFGATPAELAAGLRTALAAPDPARREAGKALAARYTWEASALRHRELYRSLPRVAR
ncbi:MSMEG_0565 family glycosyltransferase [Actinokineospora spheciospongiae]|uniref:MSMEG_0565 family glycosyltransferase n=1 Tax=Actinokineospora spheciospongiae TaxID=909613 RepID=UPI000D70CFEC|nr:MSMEG_0565 family glycosyltransferase [Actinokineospora spheciospongiae]PWW58248.1 glycosyltransferase-like protein [Actinokineospora spheciospongiae]